MIDAVILAAGASSRMGEPKAGVRVPGAPETFLERLVGTLLAARVPRVTIVSGAHPDAVRQAWRRRDARVRFVRNPDWHHGQLRSLQTGLAAVRGHEFEAALVGLVDVPFATVATVQQIIAVWRRTRAPIVRPARGEAHGHPVIFDATMVDALMTADPAVGAKAVVRARAAEIVNVQVSDAGAFRDFDTPADLATLRDDGEPPAVARDDDR